MAQHKWHKEIKAWADGAIIQFQMNGQWIDCQDNDPSWDLDTEYRIKPQPKEPQYLYVYETGFNAIAIQLSLKDNLESYKCIGKIKLEVDDE